MIYQVPESHSGVGGWNVAAFEGPALDGVAVDCSETAWVVAIFSSDIFNWILLAIVFPSAVILKLK